MEITKTGTGANHVVDFKAQKKSQAVPVIIDEIKEDGITTHYLCEGGKIYEKSAYDRNFATVRGKVMPEGYKGKTLDGRVIL